MLPSPTDLLKSSVMLVVPFLVHAAVAQPNGHSMHRDTLWSYVHAVHETKGGIVKAAW
jgi:hypothetical protein